MDADLDKLLRGVEQGDSRSTGRLMTLLEDEGPGHEAALHRLYQMEGRALVVGVTGWPGVGKSSLISGLAAQLLDSGKRVGVIAVDPTSPLSGGGLLGDRVRLKGIEGREGLFIRSVASRGHQGGLSRSARAFARALEVTGYEIVLLETVGVGQDQVNVSLVADTTVVVVAPGLGDFLQAIKSGVLEVGDIFVVNKNDRPDAEKTALDLEMSLKMRERNGWSPPVIRTVATQGTGIGTLAAEITRHASYRASGEAAPDGKMRAARAEIWEAVKSRLLDHYCGRHGVTDELVDRHARELCERRCDPYMVADLILAAWGIG